MRRSARAMTLLEVVLAMSALASISTLVAALWSQTRDWTTENASHLHLLATERALALLTEQWETRVLIVALGDEEAAVSLGPRAMRFVTTTPILFRDAPMVSVRYEINQTAGHVVGEEEQWELVYTESPVLNPASASAGSSGSIEYESLTLIEQAQALRWEQWLDERAETDVDSKQARVGWFAVAAPVEVEAIAPAEEREQEDLNAAAARAQERKSKPQLRAGRLTGNLNGAPFAWQFIAAPLR